MAKASKPRAIWNEIQSSNDSGKRCLHSSIVFRHYIITFGGGGTDGIEEALNNVIVFDMDSYEWHEAEIKGFKPESRWGHSACLYEDSKMIVFGGIHKVGLLNETLIMTLSDHGSSKLSFPDNLLNYQLQESLLSVSLQRQEVLLDSIDADIRPISTKMKCTFLEALKKLKTI